MDNLTDLDVKKIEWRIELSLRLIADHNADEIKALIENIEPIIFKIGE